MGGRVVTIASQKGGSGKTTLACCLSVHWQINGRKPLLIDADPQRSAVRLAERGEALGGVSLIEHAATSVTEAVENYSGDHGITVIDTPGFDSDITIAALSIADLVLIPVKASPLDVDRMMDTIKTLMTGPDGGTQNFHCVLTQTTRGSVISRHVRSELEDGHFPILSSDMPNRVAYAEAGLFGATPSLTAPGSPAAKDIAAIAIETEALLGKG